MIAALWGFVERHDSTESELNLNDFENWISNASMFDLLKRIEQVRIYLLTLTEKTQQDDELRNHVLFCQQVEAYLLLKHVISTDDIGLLPHAIARAVVMFHGTKKFNYQMKTLFMFWIINTSASSDELKKAILANSLVNIQGKENKFISLDLHLELHNGYMKKVMRDRRTSSIDIPRLFEYSSRFASTVRNQLL